MKVLSVTADKTNYSQENMCAGSSSNCLMFGYEDNLTFSRFYFMLCFTLGLCNFNFPQLQAMLRWPGRGLLFSPNFDPWGQCCVLTQSITPSKALSQEYTLYAPPFASVSLCDTTLSITGIPKSRTGKEVLFLRLPSNTVQAHNSYKLRSKCNHLLKAAQGSALLTQFK